MSLGALRLHGALDFFEVGSGFGLGMCQHTIQAAGKEQEQLMTFHQF